jgi:hypothetical protein
MSEFRFTAGTLEWLAANCMINQMFVHVLHVTEDFQPVAWPLVVVTPLCFLQYFPYLLLASPAFALTRNLFRDRVDQQHVVAVFLAVCTVGCGHAHGNRCDAKVADRLPRPDRIWQNKFSTASWLKRLGRTEIKPCSRIKHCTRSATPFNACTSPCLTGKLRRMTPLLSWNFQSSAQTLTLPVLKLRRPLPWDSGLWVWWVVNCPVAWGNSGRVVSVFPVSFWDWFRVLQILWQRLGASTVPDIVLSPALLCVSVKLDRVRLWVCLNKPFYSSRVFFWLQSAKRLTESVNTNFLLSIGGTPRQVGRF